MAGMAAVIADIPHGYAISYFAERKPKVELLTVP